MNEQDITIEIKATVSINGIETPDALIEIKKVVIGQITLPNVDVS